MQRMKAHVSILGLVYGVLGVVQLSAAALFAIFGVGGGLLTWMGGGEGSGAAGAIMSFAGIGVGLIFFLYGAITSLTAWGLLTRRAWGRWLGVIASVMNLLSFSWISLFGIYGLWALLGSGSSQVFERRI